MNKYKFYEEKAKKLGKKLLIEEASLCISPSNVDFPSTSKLIESQGQLYEALAIVKNVPVSKYTENQNGRSYPKKLWEKILNDKVYEGTYALADHPENEGSVRDIWGTWREMEVREDGVYGTLYLIEEKPVRILRSGSKLGLSSVGYGELDEHNVVIPESYELERLADIVMNPSQGTYMKTENLQENKNIEKSNSLFSESITNKCNNKIEETKSEETYNMLNETVNIKNNIRVILKEAKSNKKSIKEAIDDIKFWQTEVPMDQKELHSYINNSLTELSEKMESDISSATKSLKEKELSFDELKAKYKVAEDTIKDLTDMYKKAQSLIESGSLEDSKVLMENASKMQSDLNKLLKERTLMETDISIFNEEVSAMKSDIKVLMKERKDMFDDIKVYEKKLTEAEKHIQGLEKILEDDYGYAFEDDGMDNTEIITASDLDAGDIVVDGEVFEPKDNDIMLGEDEMPSDVIDQEDGSLNIADIDDDDSVSYSEHYYKKYKEADDDKDDKEDKDDDKKDDKDDDLKEADMDDKMAAIRAGKSPDDAKDDEAEKEKDKKDDKKDDDKKDESIKRLNTNKVQESTSKTTQAIAQLFNEAVVKNKALNDVKKQIFESKSVLEAVSKIQKFTEIKGNESIAVTKTQKDNTVVEYKFKR